MPRDTSGNTSPLPGTLVSTGDTVLPSQHNPMVQDVYAMITQSLSRDGQGGMRTDLDMSGFKISNVGVATLDTDAVSLSQSKQNGIPVGSILDYAGSSAPSTFMFAFGQAISRVDYPDAFSAIGTTYGAGDGSTTFNLPDLRGRVTAGKDDMGGTSSTRLSAFWSTLATTLGGAFGTASHILTTGQMPSHNHSVTDPGHFHVFPTYGTSGTNITGGPTTTPFGSTTTSTETKTTGITIQNSGSDQAHTNTQPTMVMNKIIKVSY